MESGSPEHKVIETLESLGYATKLALALHKYDVDKAYTWMITKNDLLFGRKPYEVIMTDADLLIEWLEERT